MPTNSTDFIQSMYQKHANRVGEYAGVAAWQRKLDAGASEADVEAGFMRAARDTDVIGEAIAQGHYGTEAAELPDAAKQTLGLLSPPEKTPPAPRVPYVPPVIASPTLPATPPPPAAVDLTRAGDDSTATQLQGLLTKDSPYLERARGSAVKQAASRGLQNTTMAAEAGEQAAISAALPIASQDAAQTAAKNLSFQNYGQQTGLLGQELDYRASESAMLRAHEKGMQLQEQDYLGTQAELDRATQVGIAESDIVARQALLDADLEVQQLRDLMNVDASDRGAVVTGMANAKNAYTNAFNAIMSNPDLDADTRGQYLEHIAVQRDDDLRNLKNVYNIDLDWTIAAPASNTPAVTT